jgi:5-methylcytosine-specific restriction endonuclease McrA
MTQKERRRYRQRKQWIEFRAYILDQADHRCFMCNGYKKKGLQIHHLDPSTYGHEKETDVVVLCSACHKEIERLLHKKKLDINKYIERMRKLYDYNGTA